MKGYVRLPGNLFSLGLEGKEIKVYALLRALSFAAHGRSVKISVAAMSRHTALCEASIKQALSTLAERGLIMRSKTYYDGRRQADRYRVPGAGISSPRGYIVLDLALLSRYPGHKLMVYLALCRHANRRKVAYPGERTLAAETGMSRNTVRKYTAELEAEGAITRYIRFYRKDRPTLARRSFAYLVAPTTRGGSNHTPIYNPQKILSKTKKEGKPNTLHKYTKRVHMRGTDLALQVVPLFFPLLRNMSSRRTRAPDTSLHRLRGRGSPSFRTICGHPSLSAAMRGSRIHFFFVFAQITHAHGIPAGQKGVSHGDIQGHNQSRRIGHRTRHARAIGRLSQVRNECRGRTCAAHQCHHRD